MAKVSYEHVLKFWFDETTRPFWFKQSEVFDAVVRTYLQEPTP